MLKRVPNTVFTRYLVPADEVTQGAPGRLRRPVSNHDVPTRSNGNARSPAWRTSIGHIVDFGYFLDGEKLFPRTVTVGTSNTFWFVTDASVFAMGLGDLEVMSSVEVFAIAQWFGAIFGEYRATTEYDVGHGTRTRMRVRERSTMHDAALNVTLLKRYRLLGPHRSVYTKVG
ncbi:hypothetical protein P43SY_008382 [Pythium insidiosum]|uniref:Uncharacterized protein n=1 Tax=Pythium insidiosum TaxID=114742 RepID=A0AAD5Q647_PYTIN|nr:hypothetical protein P43SY_008382 [Pythium insidiosum]